MFLFFKVGLVETQSSNRRISAVTAFRQATVIIDENGSVDHGSVDDGNIITRVVHSIYPFLLFMKLSATWPLSSNPKQLLSGNPRSYFGLIYSVFVFTIHSVIFWISLVNVRQLYLDEDYAALLRHMPMVLLSTLATFDVIYMVANKRRFGEFFSDTMLLNPFTDGAVKIVRNVVLLMLLYGCIIIIFYVYIVFYIGNKSLIFFPLWKTVFVYSVCAIYFSILVCCAFCPTMLLIILSSATEREFLKLNSNMALDSHVCSQIITYRRTFDCLCRLVTMLEDKFSHLLFTSCFIHAINVLLVLYFLSTVDKVSEITNLIVVGAFGLFHIAVLALVGDRLHQAVSIKQDDV